MSLLLANNIDRTIRPRITLASDKLGAQRGIPYRYTGCENIINIILNFLKRAFIWAELTKRLLCYSVEGL